MQNNDITINCKALLKYLEKEQIAFQFVDGLMVFAQPETGVYEDKYQAEEVKYMNDAINEAQSLKIVKPDEVIDNCASHIGFNDFARWSQPKDLLILVDDSLLLCLPNYENYNEVFEKVA